MKIKTYLVAASIWLIILSVGVISKPSNMTYQIQFDRTSTQSAEVKNEVLRRYTDLIRGVHEESEAVLLLHNLNYFMWDETMQATWANNELNIRIGNGDGAVIRGDLDAKETCLPEVKTKSLFQELFN